MTRFADHRSHADALRNHQISTRLSRLRRQAIVLFISVLLGGLSVPGLTLNLTTLLAAGTYYWAETKLLLVSGWARDVGIDIHYPNRTDKNRSARDVIAHPYFQQHAQLVFSRVQAGCWIGVAVWLVSLIALR